MVSFVCLLATVACLLHGVATVPILSTTIPPTSTRGSSITFVGTGFSEVAITHMYYYKDPAYTVDGLSCDNLNINNDTIITCLMNPGTGIRYFFFRLLSGEDILQSSFRYPAPFFSYVTPNYMVPALDTIRIAGGNFGDDIANIAVIINSRSLDFCTIFSVHTILECKYNISEFATRMNFIIKVKVDGQETPNRNIMALGEPSLINVTSPLPTTGGDRATITGLNFGDASVGLGVLFGFSACTNIFNLDIDTLTCVVPPGVGKEIGIRFRILSTIYENFPVTFNYEDPQIKTISKVPTTGGKGIINGKNFSPNITLSNLTVLYGTHTFTPESSDQIVAHYNFSCFFEPGIGPYYISISISGAPAVHVGIWNVYQEPVVHNATSIAISGGTTTIYGTNFGPHLSAYSVSAVNSNLQSFATSCIMIVPHYVIACTFGPFLESGSFTLLVNLWEQFNNDSNTALLVRNKPVINSVNPPPTTSGSNIIIYGEYLSGSNVTVVMVPQFSSSKLCTVIFYNYSMIYCTAPAGSGRYDLRIIVDDLSHQTGWFLYKDATISTVVKTDTTGGTIVVYGENFGNNASEIFFEFRMESTISAEYTPCTGIEMIIPHIAFSCFAPEGVGRQKASIIYINTVPSNILLVDLYNPPQILEASLAPYNGGIISISGHNFGFNESLIKVLIGGTKKCDDVRIVSTHTKLQCKVGEKDTFEQRHISIEVDSVLNMDNNTLFSYENNCGNISCESNNTCTNASLSRCTCFPGFEPFNNTCEEINECITNDCNIHADCIDLINGFACKCHYGYRGDGRSCIPILCEINNGGCDPRVVCVNNTCPECPLGTHAVGQLCVSDCGDGFCNTAIEDCITCAKDCNSTCEKCGDSVCDPFETCHNCSEDCTVCAPAPCPFNCHNNGVCKDGQCVCNPQWIGPSCNKGANEPIVVVVNPVGPGLIVESPSSPTTKLQLSIKSIAERNETHILRSYLFKDINFTVSSTQIGKNIQYNFSSTINNGASLNITMWKFEEEETTILFAGVETVYKSQSIKIGISVFNWPFYSLVNNLIITFDSFYGNDNYNNDCIKKSENENDSLRWFLATVDGVSLYGQFQDKVVIDGRIRTIKFTYNADNTIHATLPHFWQSADIDPNYSVLLGDENEAGDCGSLSDDDDSIIGNKRDKLLPLYIVLPIVFVIAVIALGLYFYPRFKTWRQIKRSKKVPENEMDQVNIEKRNDMHVNTVAGQYHVQM